MGELWQACKKEHLPNFLDIYEKLLTENGGKFFVGNQLTWADLMVAELLDRFAMFNKNDGGDSFLASHKNLTRLVKHVLALPNIKKYVAKRPQSVG
uniref:GST C-terminal domain-containing protein n=1 Tax=Romanomermis culicivorax TaxID=13658 RepID=A0A915KMZ0_ROMCU